jgi:hypothetical protein
VNSQRASSFHSGKAFQDAMHPDNNFVLVRAARPVRANGLVYKSIAGAKLVNLRTVFIYTGKHKNHAVQNVGNPVPQFSFHLAGDGNDVHYGFGVYVPLSGVNDIDFQLFDKGIGLAGIFGKRFPNG